MRWLVYLLMVLPLFPAFNRPLPAKSTSHVKISFSSFFVLQPDTDSVTRYRPTAKVPPETENLWPVKTPPVLKGSLLPDHRIIAFYGNLFSKKMGILGKFPPVIVLSKLQKKVRQWEEADSTKKVIPALELITVSAQSMPGKDSLYRLRMPYTIVDSVLEMAKSINALVILDFQIGRSTVEEEIPHYKKYLKMPNVELAVDPEFAMKKNQVPGRRIGSLDATDINFCIQYLKYLVDTCHLPPKLLIVHRFTENMVTNYKDIKPCSQVQVIMDMDGFGSQYLKKESYHEFIYKQPVEYTGIKLFFKNDNMDGHKMMSPEEVLQLFPQPVYVQYQ